jgi:hypothetical protein
MSLPIWRLSRCESFISFVGRRRSALGIRKQTFHADAHVDSFFCFRIFGSRCRERGGEVGSRAFGPSFPTGAEEAREVGESEVGDGAGGAVENEEARGGAVGERVGRDEVGREGEVVVGRMGSFGT